MDDIKRVNCQSTEMNLEMVWKQDVRRPHSSAIILEIIITITIFSSLIAASTALFFTNYCVGLESDSYSRQSY